MTIAAGTSPAAPMLTPQEWDAVEQLAAGSLSVPVETRDAILRKIERHRSLRAEWQRDAKARKLKSLY